MLKSFIPATLVLLFIALIGILGWAQNPSLTPFQITVTAACTGNMNASVATNAVYCFGTDGIYESIKGGATVRVDVPPAATGVSSVSVNGGAPQTGAVSITVPTIATLPSQTVSVTIPANTGPIH